MPPTSPAGLGHLRSLIRDQARRWRRLELLRAAGLAVAAPLALLAAAALLDAAFGLPPLVRAVAAVGVVGLAGFLGYRLVVQWRDARMPEEAAALAIEQATPGGVQNRLINSIQLAAGDGTGDPALAAAVVSENTAALEQTRLAPAATARPALVPLAVALALVAGGALAATVAPDRFATAADRMLRPFAASGSADHATPDVPVADADNGPAVLTGLRATLTPPAYTAQPARTVEVAGGDVEALAGTTADVVFTFDRPADAVVLHLSGKPAAELERRGPTEFRGTLAFAASTGYRLETRRGAQSHTSGLYAVRVLPDLPPRLELSGLAGITDPPLEAKLPVTARATDDIGLDQVGVFARPVGGNPSPQPPPRNGEGEKDQTPPSLVAGPREAPLTGPASGPKGVGGLGLSHDDGWVPLHLWAGERKTDLRRTADLLVQSLGVVEGGRVEVALRGRDTNPARAGTWVIGPVFTLTVGGEGAALQVQYEQILRTETELKAVLAAQRELEEKAAAWLKKLDAGSGVRWDDAKNVDELHAALAALAKEQQQVQARASAAGRGMSVLAGNLKVSVGLLADAEMTRAGRAIDAVAGQAQERKRAALGEARVTQTRTARSLAEILEHYATFRQEWEAEHAVPFVKMLADRQAALRDESVRHAATAPSAGTDALAARRQTKLGDLAALFAPALTSAGERLAERDADLAAGFRTAGDGLRAETLKQAVVRAADAARAGKWSDAVPPQTEAARHLAAVHDQLRKSLEDSARKALQALAEKAKSDVEAQKAIDKLKPGTDKTFLDIPAKLNLTDVMHLQEVAHKGKGAAENPKPNEYLFPDSAKGSLQQPDTGKRQEFDILKLASAPSKTPSFPKQSDREANSVKPHIQEKFEDLVGKLLEEADEITEKYETYNLNAAFNINEPGEIGKQGGDLNSTAAAAATGNMKPPPTNVGGATRSGRQGARAHGMTVGDESLNRRGRDKVQEGQERVGDQAGSMKQKLSDDPQKDTSTGVGGKKVETDDAKFSVADKGKWTDDMAKRLDKPQTKQFIVERQDGKLDPKMGELFRDVNARQEQLIERVKAIKKELRNLYLPTEHLDEIEAQLQASLDRLKERPDAEGFRRHHEALEKLRAAVRVFSAPAGGFETGTPRDRAVRGRALDDPARAALPGYEDATKRYYEQLSR